MPLTQPMSPRPPTPLQVAQKLYGAAFDPTSRREIAEAQQDFGQLTPVEQQFTFCHLLYLNLQSQARIHQLIRGGLRLLENLTGATYAIADQVHHPLATPLSPEDGPESGFLTADDPAERTLFARVFQPASSPVDSLPPDLPPLQGPDEQANPGEGSGVSAPLEALPTARPPRGRSGGRKAGSSARAEGGSSPEAGQEADHVAQ